MQSVGERLEEARKRKGISLREAAEATKIRSDFLGWIETNKTDFDLPEIYKRGFLKNYARYLKLDVDKIMTDYNAQLLSHSRLGKKGGAEWFGQMEVKKTENDPTAEVEAPKEPAPYGRIAAKEPVRSENTYEDKSEDDESDKTFYLKIGLIFVGTLALVFVVFGLISAILGGGGSDSTEAFAEQPEMRSPGTGQASETQTPLAGGSDQITLTASGNVYVLVRQRSNNEELYKRTMAAGESVTLDKEGAVDILFTAGENLIIEQGSERFRPNTNGTAKISLQ
jgi:transcriptional regulator with XRE-family HTH domain